MRKKKDVQGVACVGVLLILVLVILFSGLRLLESTVLFSGGESGQPAATKTITRNGVDYFPRQDVTVILVMGIDREGPAESSGYYRNDGSADSVMLLVFDEKNRECTVLNLNRDTMLDMNVLGIRGEYAGTAYGQLALAHTYGDGLESSCENVKKTLMNYLHGMTIDYYVAMNMDALPILNDAVGGVTVNVREDFSQVNPTITMGELTLRGDQVLDFVRTRKDVGDQKNVSRMERQKAYVDGFLRKLQDKAHSNTGFIRSVYEDAAPYLVSDCPVNTLSSMMERYAGFEIREIVTPEGENVIGNGHYEFYADEEKLDALILRLFYAPK